MLSDNEAGGTYRFLFFKWLRNSEKRSVTLWGSM